jgi:hypothetical protein
VIADTQASVLVPVAEYVLAMLGETLIELVLAPVLQLYVAAPFKFRTRVSPIQMVPVLPVIVSTGTAFTFTESVSKEIQPKVFVPTTE